VLKTARLAGLASACLLLCALAASAEDNKEAPRKGQLPQNWAKLGLSEEQKSKVYTIQSDYKAKIDVLKKQLAELQKMERLALEEVLTDGQKTRLKELILDKVPGAKPDKPKDK
jgi:Spy/CpxP family protein refolding chaperone